MNNDMLNFVKELLSRLDISLSTQLLSDKGQEGFTVEILLNFIGNAPIRLQRKIGDNFETMYSKFGRAGVITYLNVLGAAMQLTYMKEIELMLAARN